jgi:ADP-heptose:LPS heptosyltransferase
MINLSHAKILLVRNDNIGDLICTTPAIEALRKKYPNNQIDIVVNSYNYSAIHNNPFVNTIYCYTKPKHKQYFIDKVKALLGKIKIMWKINRVGYGVVVVFRGGYSQSAEIFSKITSAKYKVGVKNPRGKDNFNIYTTPEENKHEVEFCLTCLTPFGVRYNGEKTRYFVDITRVKEYIQYTDYVLFHISSRVSENRYSIKHFKQIIDNLERNNILISAEPQDVHNACWIENNTQATFIPTSSLEDLAALIQNVKLCVTLDGGVMHIAPALGVKTIAISGKTNMNKWHPWGYNDLVLQDKSRIASNINPQIVVRTINSQL